MQHFFRIFSFFPNGRIFALLAWRAKPRNGPVLRYTLRPLTYGARLASSTFSRPHNWPKIRKSIKYKHRPHPQEFLAGEFSMPTRPLFSFVLLLAITPAACSQLTAQEISAKLCEEITHEATAPNHGPAGRPLPLAAHWNVTGMYKEGFTPAYQRELLQQGRHILPWLEWPPTDRDLDTNLQARRSTQAGNTSTNA